VRTVAVAAAVLPMDLAMEAVQRAVASWDEGAVGFEVVALEARCSEAWVAEAAIAL
jgi:hypothetical protein